MRYYKIDAFFIDSLRYLYSIIRPLTAGRHTSTPTAHYQRINNQTASTHIRAVTTRCLFVNSILQTVSNLQLPVPAPDTIGKVIVKLQDRISRETLHGIYYIFFHFFTSTGQKKENSTVHISALTGCNEELLAIAK
jgi:hypothetical protein